MVVIAFLIASNSRVTAVLFPASVPTAFMITRRFGSAVTPALSPASAGHRSAELGPVLLLVTKMTVPGWIDIVVRRAVAPVQVRFAVANALVAFLAPSRAEAVEVHARTAETASDVLRPIRVLGLVIVANVVLLRPLNCPGKSAGIRSRFGRTKDDSRECLF